MDALEAIRHMSEQSGASMAAIARELGRSKNSMYNMFAKGSDPRTSTLVEVARACGYSLVLEGRGERIEVDA